jgi:hypothetical protein
MRIVMSIDGALRGPGIASVVTLWRQDGTICMNLGVEHDVSATGETPFELTLEVDRLDLAPGDYFFDVGLYEPGWDRCYDFHDHAYALKVIGDGPATGVMWPPHRWELKRPARLRGSGAGP